MASSFNRTELERLMQERGVDTPAEKNRSPKKKESTKAGIVISAILGCVYFAVLLLGRFIFPEESEFMQSIDVFSGEEAPNSLIRILSYALLTLSASQILRLFMQKMAERRTMTKRSGRAIIDLLSNCVKYAAILILVFLSLGALGLDTAEILAGIGILSLILGLGMESLIEDVVAGIFIIAENLYDVGDIVIADEFRGTILSIGIRSTQIEDEGGDILIVRNSCIESLVNMTDRASYAICDIPIGPTIPIAQVEEIINNANLEKLQERYPEIEKGPYYLGLSEITEEGVKILTFVAVCQENTKYWIQRIINRELAQLFDDNDIILGYDSEEDEDEEEE